MDTAVLHQIRIGMTKFETTFFNPYCEGVQQWVSSIETRAPVKCWIIQNSPQIEICNMPSIYMNCWMFVTFCERYGSTAVSCANVIMIRRRKNNDGKTKLSLMTLFSCIRKSRLLSSVELKRMRCIWYYKITAAGDNATRYQLCSGFKGVVDYASKIILPHQSHHWYDNIVIRGHLYTTSCD